MLAAQMVYFVEHDARGSDVNRFEQLQPRRILFRREIKHFQLLTREI